MSEQKVAISTHPVVTRPPRLSEGQILPKGVRDFENHCLNYFVNAKESIPDDAKVARILSSFEDFLVNDWICVDRDRLVTLTFEQFMFEFRTRWLPLNWEEQVLDHLLSARFDPKKIRFGPWAYQVQSLNAYLRGTPLYLDDDTMRFRLYANLDEELQLVARMTHAMDITDL
ncbi:hypothetical protein EI94DRAFT_1720238 [Lactarius quietus]|nr:hypothetical protein EI94DRAFT_1720238 [Lactarius quietus]